MSLSTWVSSAGQNSQSIIAPCCLQRPPCWPWRLLHLRAIAPNLLLQTSELSSQSRTVASFCPCPSPMWFLEWSTAKVQLLPTSSAQGEGTGGYRVMGSQIGKGEFVSWAGALYTRVVNLWSSCEWRCTRLRYFDGIFCAATISVPFAPINFSLTFLLPP